MPHLFSGAHIRRTLTGFTTSSRASVLALVLATASCANIRPATESGFLEGGYDKLEPAPERQTWGVPDEINLHFTKELEQRITAGEVRRIYVEPAVYIPGDNVRYRPTSAAGKRLAGYTTRKFRIALERHFDVIDEPLAGSVTVRLALTDMMDVNVWINSVAALLAVPVDQGDVSGEIEVVDSVTGERLMAMTAVRGGTAFLALEAFNHHGHVRHGIKKWAGLTTKLLRGR